MSNGTQNIWKPPEAKESQKENLSASDRKVLFEYLRDKLRPFKLSNWLKELRIKVSLGSTNPVLARDDIVYLTLVNMNIYCTHGDGALIKDETGLPFSASIADPHCGEKLFEFMRAYTLNILHDRLKTLSSWVTTTQNDIERLED
jgi:hypothetical protein